MDTQPKLTLRNDLNLGAFGLGCWAIGGPFRDPGGWMGYGSVDDRESVRAIQRALDLGVRFFDVSDVYGCGHAERILGQALEGHEVTIAAKFGYTFDETTRTVTGRDTSPTGVRRSLEASLGRLRRETIDLYQLHLHDVPIEEALNVRETLEELVQEGLIRAYAWCTENPDRLRAFATSTRCVAAPQLLNVLESNPSLLALCDELGLTPIARRPLGMGLLTGKFSTESRFEPEDMRSRFGWDFRAGKQAAQLRALAAVRETLTSGGRTLAQGALAWIWARSPRAVPIPGFKNVVQVEENIGALRFGPLSAAQLLEIEAVRAAETDV